MHGARTTASSSHTKSAKLSSSTRPPSSAASGPASPGPSLARSPLPCPNPYGSRHLPQPWHHPGQQSTSQPFLHTHPAAHHSSWHAHHKLAVARTCSRSPLHNGPATTIYNLCRTSVTVHALMHLHPLHSPRHLTQLQTALNPSLGYTVPTLPSPPLGPPISLSPPVLPPHFLPPSPSSLEAAMQSAHAQLLQPHLWPSFTLSPRLPRVTKPKNIQRAYARSLRPTVSDLWRQRILHPAPASLKLYRPALYLRLLPKFASIPLLRLRCQGSALPTHQFLSPTTRRHVPYLPPHTLGDELHMILACPPRAPQFHPVISVLSHLLVDHALSRAAFNKSSLQESSGFGPSAPSLRPSDQDRAQWIRELAPLAASFAIALCNSFATP